MQLKSQKTQEVKKRKIERIKTTAKFGLTNEQVKQIREAGYSNTLSNKSYKTVKQIIFDNLFTFFNLVFFILGVCLFIAHSYKDMSFLMIIVLNTLIGIFQQVRSKIKLDKLTLISSPKSIVVALF